MLFDRRAALDLSPEAGCQLVLNRGWLADHEATALEHGLVQTERWEEREIVLFGRKVMQPRLIAWAGDVPYNYSGQCLVARKFSRELQQLKDRVERHAGSQFNHVLINRYRNGQDSMGWHSDDERALGTDPVLASLSLGCSRRFLLRPRPSLSQSPSLEVLLEHGDLLLMGGALQQRYQHSVPKQRAIQAERINLTFRRVYV